MIEAASLGVGVAWKDAGAVRGMKDLQREVQNTARNAQSEFGRMEQNVRSALGGVGKAVGGLGIAISLAVVAKKAIDTGKELIQAGSNAEEMLGKYNTVFGAYAEGVTQQLDAFGGAVGRSKFELQEMAAGVQDTFVPLGFAREEASRLSVSLTELATDVASFNNASDPEVMNSFKSALVGNHEAVRQYGIVITEATLNSELLRMGIEGGIKAASEQEKVMARLNLIYAGTSDAQGDAERTSGSWANTMRGLNSVIADTKAEIGLELLPVLTVLTPMLQQFTDLARNVGPELTTQVGLMASAFSSMVEVLGQVDLSGIAAQFDVLQQAIGVDFWTQVFGFIGKQIALTVTNFKQLGFWLSSIADQFEAFGQLISGDMSWSEYRARMKELQTEYDAGEAAFGAMYDAINNRDWSGAIAATSEIKRLNAESTDWWQRHGTAAQQAGDAIAGSAAGGVQAAIDALGKLAESALPESAAGWTEYLDQMSTAMTSSSDLIAASNDTQLALIEEYAARRNELALQYQEQDAELAAEGKVIQQALLSQELADEMAALEEFYQLRLETEAGAMSTLQEMQSDAMGTLAENLGAYMAQASEQYAGHAQNIVQIEQERDNVLAFLESQYQAQRAQFQAAGDTKALQLLNSAHKAKYGNVVAYYNQRIKTEQVGQQSVYNVAKQYYLHTLMMQRVQMVNQLRVVAGTMTALVKAMVGGYSAITAAALGAKLAQEGANLAQIQAAIADVESMMAGLEGAGVAAAAQASAAFDDWSATVDDLGGGLDGIGDSLDGIGDSAGSGVREKIIDPMEEAAKIAQGLAQMVDKAVEAFDLLAEYGGPDPGWITGYQALLDAVEVMVEMFAETTAGIVDAGLLAKEKREQLVDAVSVIGGALKVISDALRVSEAFQDVEEQTADVTAILDRLAGEITQMVHKVIALATAFNDLGKDELRDAARASEYLVTVMKPWSEAVRAVSALVSLPSVDAQQFIDRSVEQMTALALGMVEVGQNVDPAAMREASQAAEEILDALKPWEPALKAIQAIVTAPAGDISGAATRVMDQMLLLAQTLIFAQRQIDKEALEQAAESAALLVNALKPWESAAKTVAAVVSSPAGDIGDQADRLMDGIFTLIQKLIFAQRQIDRAALEELARSAGLIVDALKPWEAAAKAVDAIADASGERIGLQAEQLVGQMLGLMRKLARAADGIDRAELEQLARLAQPLVDALKPWEAAAKAVDAIADTSSARIGPQAERLVGQMLGLARKLARLADGIDRAELERLARTAQPLIDSLKPWEAAAKAVEAISHTSGERIGPQAERLVNQMLGLARKLARVARDMPAGQLQEAARAAALFSDTLQPWRDAIEVVDAFAEYAGGSTIGPQAERLVGQMLGLARKLARAAREAGLDDLEYAARVGKLFGEVLEPWEKAILLSNELRMWRELPDLQDRMTRFARIWIAIVDNLSEAARDLSTQGLDAVAAFGRSLSDLMSGLQAALEVVEEFEFEEPDPTTWANFQGWVQSVFDSYYDWINQYASPEPGLPAVPSFDEKGIQSVSLFAQALRDLMGGLEAALGIARDFEFEEPDPATWANFQGWVQSVFVSFYDWVNASVQPEPPLPAVPLFGGDGLAAVSAFAGALNSLMQGLQAALAIARDFEFDEPPEDQWNNFFTWVTGTFQTFYDDINTRYGSEDPATVFTPVQAWGGALGALMGGLQGALALAKDFEFQEPPEDQWTDFFDWTTEVFEDFRAEIVRRYPEDEPDFTPVAAWGGALGALMGGLQSALAIAKDFEFQEPPEDQWTDFFDWTTDVFEDFRAEIVRRYPADDPDQFAPVTAWASAFGALMQGLQSAISLVSEFEWTAPDPDEWGEFFDWTLEVLEGFRDAITTNYPNASAATWEPVVAWSGALSSLMQALETAVTTADSFAFIPPDDLGWQRFFDWVFEVFDAFRLEVLKRYPETPEEAQDFPAVISLSNAISAIFSGLQSALSFFMDLHGPGEAFWTFLGGAQGNPDTSPFAQRMGYVIGAITNTMAAFDAWVLENAPAWTGNANTLLTKVTTITGILSDAIELFDFMQNTNLPSTAEIEQFVTAVLQLFSSFASELTNLTGANGIGTHVNTIATTVSDFVATTMPTEITNWTTAGSELVGGLASGMASEIGPASATGTVNHAIAAIQSALAEFTGWWARSPGQGSGAGPGWTYWYNAGDALVDAFVAGMESNLGVYGPENRVYAAAYAVAAAANAGLEAGAGASGGNYRPEGPAAGLGEAAAGSFAWSTPTTSSREINVTIRFENPPANLDRRALEELKRTLVYEIRRGA